MNNSKDFKEYADVWGLKKTIDDFSDYIYEKTAHEVWPAYSFAHIVIDDFNLRNSDILFCLHDDRIKDYLLQKISDGCSCEKIVWGSHLIIEFLKWLLTIPEEKRNEVEN